MKIKSDFLFAFLFAWLPLIFIYLVGTFDFLVLIGKQPDFFDKIAYEAMKDYDCNFVVATFLPCGFIWLIVNYQLLISLITFLINLKHHTNKNK